MENVEVTVDELDEKPEDVESAGEVYKYQEIKVKNTEDEDIESELLASRWRRVSLRKEEEVLKMSL